MTCGEVSRISSSSRYAYDGRQDRPPQVPEGSSVEFEVELISFEKQPDWDRAPPDAKIQRAGRQHANCIMSGIFLHLYISVYRHTYLQICSV